MFTKQEKLQKLFPEDLYLHSNNLNEGEVDVLVELEAAMKKHIRPLLTEYTEKAEFPTEAFKKVTNEVQFFSDERLFSDDDEEQYLPSQYYLMFLYQLLASIDTSIATFVGVHAGLGYYSFLLGGSEEQKKEWLGNVKDAMEMSVRSVIRTNKIWKCKVLVINEEIAKKRKLIEG